MTGLLPLEGHTEARAAMASAIAAGQLPNSLLVHGPAGIGKQRFALWLAQRLLCQRPDAEPCGTCHPCHLAVRLEHPDLHWFFPLPRPKGASGDRLGDALEDQRAAELASRRSTPLRATAPDGMAGIYLAHVQIMLRIAHTRPAMGRRKVFVIGDAEALVPQESSPEAANAILKLLEEPPADTTLVLTAADPEVLLPTIRSRLLPVRLRPLPEADAVVWLERHGEWNADEVRNAVRIAQGSIGRAIAFLPGGGRPGPLEELRQAARALLDAALSGKPADRLAAALATSPAGARGAFSDTLEFLTLWLRDLAAAACGSEEVIVNGDSAEWLRAHAARYPYAVQGVPQAIREVDGTLQLAQLNINPQLALASLLRRINRQLDPAGPAPAPASGT